MKFNTNIIQLEVTSNLDALIPYKWHKTARWKRRFRHFPTCAVVSFRKIGADRIWLCVWPRIGLYECWGVQLKLKLRHAGTWLAAAWLHPPPVLSPSSILPLPLSDSAYIEVRRTWRMSYVVISFLILKSSVSLKCVSLWVSLRSLPKFNIIVKGYH
jgi:hypothetical protein